jgi:hypothetical protein
VKLTTQEWTLVGVALGGAISAASGLLLGYVQQRNQRRNAKAAARDSAYLELMTWFALARDHIRDTMDEKRPWSADAVNDPQAIARLDALAEMYGSKAFRAAIAGWRPAFGRIVKAHDVHLHADTSTTRVELQHAIDDLGAVLHRVREVVRREISAG